MLSNFCSSPINIEPMKKNCCEAFVFVCVCVCVSNISVEHTSNVCLSMVFDLIAYFCQYFHFIDMSSPIGIMMPFICSTPTTYYHLVWWINVIKSNLHHCCWQNNFNMIKLNGTEKKIDIIRSEERQKGNIAEVRHSNIICSIILTNPYT